MNQVVSEAGLESLQYAHSTCSLSKRLVPLISRLELASNRKISLTESQFARPLKTALYSKASAQDPAHFERLEKSAPRTGILATVSSGILFGTSVPIIKLGLDLLPADLFAAFRFTLASAIVLSFL